MIIGAHTIIYSKDPEADRTFFKDVLKFDHVDAGRGWLIFALPPGEVAVHPADEEESHELYLMCDDVKKTVAELKAEGIDCGPIHEAGWGSVTMITLPGGSELGLYEPRHEMAIRRDRVDE
jgi:catechol 2,3-dioxygenase-like lactoylglutathione lyase family enzyme